MKYFVQDVLVPVLFVVTLLVLAILGLRWMFKSEHESDVATIKDASDYCAYVTFDGHQYVKYQKGPYIGGFTHSPKCSCLTNSAVKCK